jgi:60 kDa SS-A/Ro ribonucleoprotein
MNSPVTGERGAGTTSVTCRDVAALFASAILRKHPTARVLPFHDRVEPVKLNPRDSVATNATRLASLPSGGTDCSAPLALLNAKRDRGDLVIYLSDNQSWLDAAGSRGTGTLEQWRAYRVRNPKARLVAWTCSRGTTQAPEPTTCCRRRLLQRGLRPRRRDSPAVASRPSRGEGDQPSS